MTQTCVCTAGDFRGLNSHAFGGIISDLRHTSMPHMRDIKVVCSHHLFFLCMLSHLSWAANPSVLLHLRILGFHIVISKILIANYYSSVTPSLF